MKLYRSGSIELELPLQLLHRPKMLKGCTMLRAILSGLIAIPRDLAPHRERDLNGNRPSQESIR